MKYYALFILIMAIVGGYFYGYPAYQVHQAEEKIRTSMKNIRNNASATAFNSIGGYYADAEVLNQYPKFLIYITLSNFKEKQAPEKVINVINGFSCKSIDNLKQDHEIYRKATLNLIKKDQHQVEYFIKNIYGETIYTYTQRMQNCPNFAEVEAYVPPKEQQNLVGNMPVSPETAARERQAQNGY